MNKEIENFIRGVLMNGLVRSTEKQQMKFKRMYSSKDLEKNVLEIVEYMSPDKLDEALTYLQRLLKIRYVQSMYIKEDN